MTPLQLLDAIEEGDKRTGGGRRTVVIELTAPRVLGHEGKFLGDGPYGPRYGYTRRQASKMRDVILAEAKEDGG